MLVQDRRCDQCGSHVLPLWDLLHTYFISESVIAPRQDAFTWNCGHFAASEQNSATEYKLIQKNYSLTWNGCVLLSVVLLVPLHGAVVAKHNLPQCLAQICQAGDVAVQGDMLPTKKWWGQGHWCFFQNLKIVCVTVFPCYMLICPSKVLYLPNVKRDIFRVMKHTVLDYFKIDCKIQQETQTKK